MAADKSKAYLCQACGARFMKFRNGRALILDDDEVSHEPGLACGLTGILDLAACPRCGSRRVERDVGVKSAGGQ
jgi:DNA-directed RNA polymerase subunit RPC12/RpoP